MTFAIDTLLDLWQQPWKPGPAAEDAFRQHYTDPVTINGEPATVATLVARSISLNQALTDQQRKVDQVVQTDAEVAVAFRLSGRHVGPLATKGGIAPPTGQRLELSIIDILTLTDGRVSRIRMVADELAALAAIDAVSFSADAPPARPAGSSPAPSVSFLGVHTDAFDAMRMLTEDTYQLPVCISRPMRCWSGLADDAQLHLYRSSDSYHRFFGSAPVPGLLVDSFSQTEQRLTAAEVEWLTDTDTGRMWRHYRAPDGNVYEVMGPAPDLTATRPQSCPDGDEGPIQHDEGRSAG